MTRRTITGLRILVRLLLIAGAWIAGYNAFLELGLNAPLSDVAFYGALCAALLLLGTAPVPDCNDYIETRHDSRHW